MEKVQLNPWTWQDAFGFSQGWRLDGPASLVFVSGQGSISPDGGLVGEGDIEAQATRVFENLRTVLERSGCGLDAVVKLTIYLTDITKEILKSVYQLKSLVARLAALQQPAGGNQAG